MKTIVDLKKLNRIRCIVSLVSSIVMIILVQISYALNLTNALGRDAENVGMRTLRMFTTLSNLLVITAAFLSIPYQIEGLRKNNYHLPIWIVTILYMGTTGVVLTFVTAITAISAFQGFYTAMLAETNLFLHTINPIIAFLLFTLVNDDHTVGFKHSIIAMIPMMLYSVAYLILVFIVGSENGGWTDHYNFDKVLPWPITLVVMYSLCFGVSTLLRFLHNCVHKKRKQMYINYYQNSPDIKSDTIEEALVKLAKINRKDYVKGDIIIPWRSIRMMKPIYNTAKSDSELYKIYIEAFLDE